MAKLIAPKKWPVRHKKAVIKPVMTEYQLQRALYKHWLVKRTPLSNMFHLANEGKRSEATGWRLKQIGLHPGLPDLLLKGDPNVLGFPAEAWFLELKRPGVIATPERRAQLEELTDKGWTVWCVNDLDFAIRLLEDYGVVYKP
jgi:hypothetical protein